MLSTKDCFPSNATPPKFCEFRACLFAPGVHVGDVLTLIGTEHVAGKTPKETLACIKAAARPFSIAFRRSRTLAPPPGNNNNNSNSNSNSNSNNYNSSNESTADTTTKSGSGDNKNSTTKQEEVDKGDEESKSESESESEASYVSEDEAGDSATPMSSIASSRPKVPNRRFSQRIDMSPAGALAQTLDRSPGSATTSGAPTPTSNLNKTMCVCVASRGVVFCCCCCCVLCFVVVVVLGVSFILLSSFVLAFFLAVGQHLSDQARSACLFHHCCAAVLCLLRVRSSVKTDSKAILTPMRSPRRHQGARGQSRRS